jgi:hypothetical protein
MQLAVIENENFGFLLSTKDVALGYGVSESAIRSQKSNNKDDFKEGKHFILEYNNKKLPKVMWTQKGVVRLGFFVKSKKARQFRDWAEDYITKAPTYLIDGKNPHAIIRGLKSQLSQHIKKIELQEQNIQTLIAENATLALPAPAVDLEPYKAEIKRLNDRANELYELKEHFSHMAGVQVFKTSAMMGIKDKLIELQSQFLNNPTIYSKIGEFIRECQIIEMATQENARSLKVEVV